jgi:hypothetical protein
VVQVRPLPTYDGSYGPLPAGEVTNDDLLNRYGVTKPTLFKRRDAMLENGWIAPVKVGPRLYYNASDVHVIDTCSWWVSMGYTIPEVVAHMKNQEKAYKQSERVKRDDITYKEGWDAGENVFTNADTVGAVDVEADNMTTDLVVKGLQTSAKDLQLLGDEFVAKFAKTVGEAVRQAIPRDALAAYDFLAKAADKGYLLTSKVLSEGTGLKNKTITGWSDQEDRFGFRITRINRGNYRVRRLSDEEIAAATQAEEIERAIPLKSGWINVASGQ